MIDTRQLFPFQLALTEDERRDLAKRLLQGLSRPPTQFGSGMTQAQKEVLQLVQEHEPCPIRNVVKGLPIAFQEGSIRANVQVTRTLLKYGCIGIAGKKPGDIPETGDVVYFVKDRKDQTP